MRHTINIKIEDENRDFGKLFLITEMSADHGESWAFRALLALMRNNVNLPAGFENTGMAGLAEVGLKALTGLRWEDAKPLLEEMMQCVEIIPDPSRPQVKRALIESDIEEITTRIRLRAEVWKLHTGFLKGGALSNSDAARSPAKQSRSRNT